eukprot:TRINITY_DN19880_c0_g1_i1.p1 TRINITY_DN19880_c0_g1~~TRINITY_DN19880_c0_g1_i1.p1  ORF type:complete len:194 (+),score=18.49 TRINITY_DN19880_c0_g1_i1:203-784(+)
MLPSAPALRRACTRQLRRAAWENSGNSGATGYYGQTRKAKRREKSDSESPTRAEGETPLFLENSVEEGAVVRGTRSTRILVAFFAFWSAIYAVLVALAEYTSLPTYLGGVPLRQALNNDLERHKLRSHRDQLVAEHDANKAAQDSALPYPRTAVLHRKYLVEEKTYTKAEALEAVLRDAPTTPISTKKWLGWG